MEPKAPSELHHSRLEFGNLWICQSLIRDWNSHPEWKSYDVLPSLYRSLHTGEKLGLHEAPKLSEVLRNSEAHLKGFPDDLLVNPKDLYLLTGKFTDKLDEILNQSPKIPEQAIHDAAFAYYVFERIHPFPDGNGRIGRMLVKRIFQGAGLKDPIFHDQRWYGGERSEHLDALERVGQTNNLSYLEVFLADSLIHMYDPITEMRKFEEINAVIKAKNRNFNNNGMLLKDIWEGFAGIPIYGNITSSRPKILAMGKNR